MFYARVGQGLRKNTKTTLVLFDVIWTINSIQRLIYSKLYLVLWFDERDMDTNGLLRW